MSEFIGGQRSVSVSGTDVILEDGRQWLDHFSKPFNAAIAPEDIVPICHRHGVTGQPIIPATSYWHESMHGRPYMEVPGYSAGDVGYISLSRLGNGGYPHTGYIRCPTPEIAAAIAADLRQWVEDGNKVEEDVAV